MAFPTKPAAYLLGSNGPVHALAYSASPGTYILTGSADRSVRLYNPSPSTSVEPRSRVGSIPEGRLIQTYAAHGYEVLSIAVASNNQSFVSAGGDRAVFLWDVATAVTTRRLGGNIHGHSGRINCVAFAAENDNVVVSGSFDTTTRLWDLKSGSIKPIQVFSESRDAITCVAVHGPEVITGSVDGRIRSYDIRMGKCTTDVIGASVTSLNITKDGKAILVGSLDSKLRLMDRENGTCLQAYTDPVWRNEDLRIQSMLAKREKYIIVGDEMKTEIGGTDGRVLAWDLVTGKLAARIEVPWGPPGFEAKKFIGKDGKPKLRSNVISCMAWRDDGWGDQFCVGGTSGVVTVFQDNPT